MFVRMVAFITALETKSNVYRCGNGLCGSLRDVE